MAYKPKLGQKYWMINSRFEIRETENNGGAKSLKRIEVGNCFKTAKDVKQFRAIITGQAKMLPLVSKKWWQLWR